MLESPLMIISQGLTTLGGESVQCRSGGVRLSQKFARQRGHSTLNGDLEDYKTPELQICDSNLELCQIVCLQSSSGSLPLLNRVLHVIGS